MSPNTPLAPLFTPIMRAPVMRTCMVVTLMSVPFLTGPLTTARAESAPAQATVLDTAPRTPPAPAKDGKHGKQETVTQRIADLRTALQPTKDQESNWDAVAQVMRENATTMESLVAAKKAQASQNLTALDDLKTYQEFAQAHVDGLKKLTAAFEILYISMSDAQKKNADQVFQNFGHKGNPSHS